VLTPRDRAGHDYDRGGTVYHPTLSQFHWEDGRADWTEGGDNVNATFPVTVTRGTRIRARVTLEIEPIEASDKNCVLVGRPTYWVEPKPGCWFPGFRSAPIDIAPYSSPLDITVETEIALPEGVLAYEAMQLDWGLELIDRNIVAGSSRFHNIYVTYGPPWTGTEARESGVTLKRMKAAVRVAHQACNDTWGTFENVSVRPFVEAFHRRCGAFGFQPSSNMTPQYVSDTHAVGYLNNAMGGAWPHIDHPGAGAECQALNRLAYGMVLQLGMPALLQKAYIYAHPSRNNGQEPIYHTYIDQPDGPLPTEPPLSPLMWRNVTYVDSNNISQTVPRECHLNLITMSSPQEHQRYRTEAMGINQYEAVLSVNADGEIFYYAGGAGLTSGGDENAQRIAVLNIFSALVWWAEVEPGWSVIDQIVAHYTGNSL
jgi:hypothetical protein